MTTYAPKAISIGDVLGSIEKARDKYIAQQQGRLGLATGDQADEIGAKCLGAAECLTLVLQDLGKLLNS